MKISGIKLRGEFKDMDQYFLGLSLAQNFIQEFPKQVGVRNSCIYVEGGLRCFIYRTKANVIVVVGY